MTMKKIVIADLGTGNLRSVSKAISHVTVAQMSGKYEVMISAIPEEIENADYLILPGQGAIGTWFNQLEADQALNHAIRKRLGSGPVLGICLGLQALYHDSEENNGTPGLDILPGQVRHFSINPCHQHADSKSDLKIPHMGWNNVAIVNDHPLWHGIKDGERFYFVHSYYVESSNKMQVSGECEYGNTFTAAAAHGNLFATQFHPEKSQQAGLKLLKNFVNWNGSL